MEGVIGRSEMAPSCACNSANEQAVAANDRSHLAPLDYLIRPRFARPPSPARGEGGASGRAAPGGGPSLRKKPLAPPPLARPREHDAIVQPEVAILPELDLLGREPGPAPIGRGGD